MHILLNLDVVNARVVHRALQELVEHNDKRIQGGNEPLQVASELARRNRLALRLLSRLDDREADPALNAQTTTQRRMAEALSHGHMNPAIAYREPDYGSDC